MDKQDIHRAVVIAIIIVAVLLRIFFVSHEALWGDEVFTIQFATLNIPQIIERTIHDVHPPLYFLMMYGWINLTGTSELALRFPSVMFSIISMCVFYLLLRRLNLYPLIGTALFALSLSGLVYAHEARMYSLLVLLTISSWYFLAKMLQQESGYVGYAIATTLVLYTHVAGTVVFTLNVLLIILSYPKQTFFKPKLIASTIVPLLLFTPWIPVMFIQVRDFLPLLLNRLEYNSLGIITPFIFWILFIVATLIGLATITWKLRNGNNFSMLMIYKNIMRKIQRRKWIIAVLWIVLFSFGYSFFASTNPFVRYFLFIQPLAYIFLIKTIGKNKLIQYLIMMFAIILLIINISTIDRFDWNNSVPFALQFESKNTLYALDRAGSSFFLFRYYALPTHPEIEESIVKLRIPSLEGETKIAIEDLDLTKRYVLILSKLKGTPSQYEAYLKTTHNTIANQEFSDITVRVFEPNI
jgi:uncharacterized membrane protein